MPVKKIVIADSFNGAGRAAPLGFAKQKTRE
jgi:hypothetical protein